MITVKLHGYTRDNIAYLQQVIDKGQQTMLEKCNPVCENCENKRVCSDIISVLNYLEKKINLAETES